METKKLFLIGMISLLLVVLLFGQVIVTADTKQFLRVSVPITVNSNVNGNIQSPQTFDSIAGLQTFLTQNKGNIRGLTISSEQSGVVNFDNPAVLKSVAVDSNGFLLSGSGSTYSTLIDSGSHPNDIYAIPSTTTGTLTQAGVFQISGVTSASTPATSTTATTAPAAATPAEVTPAATLNAWGLLPNQQVTTNAKGASTSTTGQKTSTPSPTLASYVITGVQNPVNGVYVDGTFYLADSTGALIQSGNAKLDSSGRVVLIGSPTPVSPDVAAAWNLAPANSRKLVLMSTGVSTESSMSVQDAAGNTYAPLSNNNNIASVTKNGVVTSYVDNAGYKITVDNSDTAKPVYYLSGNGITSIDVKAAGVDDVAAVLSNQNILKAFVAENDPSAISVANVKALSQDQGSYEDTNTGVTFTNDKSKIYRSSDLTGADSSSATTEIRYDAGNGQTTYISVPGVSVSSSVNTIADIVSSSTLPGYTLVTRNLPDKNNPDGQITSFSYTPSATSDSGFANAKTSTTVTYTGSNSFTIAPTAPISYTDEAGAQKTVSGTLSISGRTVSLDGGSSIDTSTVTFNGNRIVANYPRTCDASCKTKIDSNVDALNAIYNDGYDAQLNGPQAQKAMEQYNTQVAAASTGIDAEILSGFGLTSTTNGAKAYLTLQGLDTVASGFSGYSSLFMSKGALADWEYKLDQAFTPFTTTGLIDSICAANIKQTTQQTAYVKVPGDAVIPAATVAAECSPIIDGFSGAHLREYKFTAYVNNPQTSNQSTPMTFNIVLSGDQTINLLNASKVLQPGETFSIDKSQQPVFSNNTYTKICISFDQPPAFFGSSTVCNVITCRDDLSSSAYDSAPTTTDINITTVSVPNTVTSVSATTGQNTTSFFNPSI